MYFPYLRGKQYEFIAIRELAGKGLLEKVIPIFEPVKETNLKYFNEFQKFGLIFGIIVNPKVGHLDYNLINDLVKGYDQNTFYICILVTSNNVEEVKKIQGIYKDYKKIYIHKQYNNYFYNNLKIFDDGDFNLISSSIGNRYETLNNKVIFEDSFVRASKNSDYPLEDYFNNYHLTYKEMKYSGVSDYLTIGDTYSESGGLPYAVTIHLTILKEDGIYIKHFTSDSQDYRGDANTKFFEALDKLCTFVKQNNLSSDGIREFIEWKNNGNFPNLGPVKKASMKNHIELLSNII